MRLQIIIEQMPCDGKWTWQAVDKAAPSYDRIIGGGIYGPMKGCKTAEEAATQAIAWWNETGKPHSIKMAAAIDERRRQIKEYGQWSDERMAEWERNYKPAT